MQPGQLGRERRVVAVPLLAIFVLLSFPTQELWGIFADPTRGIYAVILGLIALLAAAFLAVRLPQEWGLRAGIDSKNKLLPGKFLPAPALRWKSSMCRSQAGK